MSVPDILTVACWLQDRHGLHAFAVDHPGRPECGGSHRECDGQRGKHPRGQWSRLATLSPRLIRAQLADGPWNIGIACKQSCLLVVDEDQPGAFTAFAGSIGQAVEPTFAVDTAKGRHWYYRQGAGAPLGNSRGRLAGHAIDIRGGGGGNGGYVVGPGSVHATGVVYTPADPSAPILPVPGWLAEALRPPARQAAAARSHRPASAYGTLCGLVRFVLGGTPGVDRNDRLFWASCRAAELVATGEIGQAAAERLLVDAALQAGLHGGEPEAVRTVTSGLRTSAPRPQAGRP